MKNHPVKQITERRISAFLRIALAALLFFVNIAAVVLLTYFLQANATVFFIILEIIAIAVAISIQSRPASASYKLAWTMLVVALPVGGLILYILWGGNHQSKRLNLLPLPPPPCKEMERRQSELDQERLGNALPNWQRASRMLSRRGFLLYRDTELTYFPSGAAFFEDVIRKLEKAERFIFLEYFILAEGKLWDRMLRVLTDRARHGVEIKIIFDDFGNITRMQGETIEKMRDEGIEVCVFNPVHQYVNRLYFNYRDHRKILCIDGQYAYTGGVNVADEYVGLLVRFGEWKDSGVLLDGPGAWGLTSQFLHMWEMLGHRAHNEHDYYRPMYARNTSGFCQPFSDGPMNNPDNPAEDLYFQCISNAHKSIWLTTPYFAVEDSIVRALCMAADCGVDVRLMLPGIPDHKYTQVVAGSYYETLLRHGVRIYEFTPGFLHAKSLLADGEMAVLGTINMDYRSFQLHYECGVAVYGTPFLQDLQADMEDIMD
ncbi:MAG: cardiolipin synthase, partial [Oscillospiraceae bacterium]|nr:cardiolipin synthase [Oscillospiraceae bacterium]